MPAPASRSNRLIRAILWLFPPSFLAVYREELSSFIDDAEQEAADRGGKAWRIRFRVRLASDLVATALRLRLRAVRPRLSFRPSQRGDGPVTTLIHDLRYALRAFRRSPGFFLGSILTLGLGMGATTTLFSVVDGVVFRDLPYPDGERMLAIGTALRLRSTDMGPFSPADFVDIRNASTTLATFVAAGSGAAVLRDDDEPEVVSLARVSEGFLAAFGASPVHGRLFVSADHAAGAERVAVLSHRFWLDRWGGDPSIVGQSVKLSEDQYTVAGVVAPRFPPPEALPASNADVWVTLGLADSTPTRRAFYLSTVGLPHPGISQAAVHDELNSMIGSIYEQDGVANFVTGIQLTSLREATLGDVSRPLAAFTAAVGLLLLIGCANVANLLLARGAARGQEITVRAVLGAPSSRILRQLLTESIILGLASGGVGLLAAVGALNILQSLNPGGIPRLAEIGIDPRAFAFALTVSIVTAVLTGLVPALHAVRADPATTLKGMGRSATSGVRQGRLRGALVVTETAMAIVLVLGSGLLFNSFIRLMTVDPGFDPRGVVNLQADLRYATGIGREQWAPFFNSLLERVRVMPNIESAALTVQVPFTRDGIVSSMIPEGLETEDEDGAWIPLSTVSDRFFETMRIPLLQGRVIDASDRASTEPVAVVNQAFVRQYWPDAPSALEKTVAEGGPDEPVRRVVGVVGDLRYNLGRDPIPHIYIPFEQDPPRVMSVVVRVNGDVTTFASQLRAQIRDLAPDLPISRVASIETLASASLGQPRFFVVLTVVFGVLALLLALTGIYGTTAYSAGLRAREIGIRIALGAEPATIERLIVKRALMLVGLGLAIGVVCCAIASRLLTAFLFEIDPTDLPTFTMGALLVALSAAIASWVPARRASHTDATVTLREGG